MKTSKIIFWTCLSISILLTVAGFLVPPTGVIDGSVLTAVGELLGFSAIGIIPSLLNTDKSVKITKGDTCIELNNDDNE